MGSDAVPVLAREPEWTRAPPGDPAVTKDIEHFVYAHRGFQYALPVGDVLEIVQVPALLPFHGVMPGVLGNMVHRHHLLPVLDGTALCTSLGRASDHPVDTVVVIQREGRLCALAIDRYIAVVPLGQQPATDGDSHRGTTGADSASGQRGPATDRLRDAEALVESVLIFRDDTLMVLSAAALILRVRAGFGSQPQSPIEGPGDGGALEEAADPVAQGYLCASIGGIVLGIPIEPVIEVIEHYEVMPLFMVDSSLRGLLNLRGHVVAVLDISADLNLPLRTLEEISQFIVVRTGEVEFALSVDKVVRQERLRPEQIQSADSMITGELARYLAGVYQSDTGPIFIISVANILDLPRLQPLLSRNA